MIAALVHTQGVVLDSQYVPLEMAYLDALGGRAHVHITSPISFTAMRKFFPHSRSDVTVITEGGTSYRQVLAFLRDRFQLLSYHLGPTVAVGYKGASYQPQILRDAGIPSLVNVETLGVPALTSAVGECPWHRGSRSKCAAVALNQILRSVQGGPAAIGGASPSRPCAAVP